MITLGACAACASLGQGVFANKVIGSEDKSVKDPEIAARLASGNGAWDHLAANQMAQTPMGTGQTDEYMRGAR